MEATHTLKVWRLHPSSCPIVRAEKTLHGAAHRAGVRWCGPFTNANRAGWWVFPPVDVDIVWKGGGADAIEKEACSVLGARPALFATERAGTDPIDLAGGSGWLMRCDRVDFDPGGVAPPKSTDDTAPSELNGSVASSASCRRSSRGSPAAWAR